VALGLDGLRLAPRRQQALLAPQAQHAPLGRAHARQPQARPHLAVGLAMEGRAGDGLRDLAGEFLVGVAGSGDLLPMISASPARLTAGKRLPPWRFFSSSQSAAKVARAEQRDSMRLRLAKSKIGVTLPAPHLQPASAPHEDAEAAPLTIAGPGPKA